MSSLDRDLSLPVATEREPMSERESAPSVGEERNSRKYWRSLDRLLDSPAVSEAPAVNSFEAHLGEEFPAGASEMPSGVDRRTMLGIMGASFAMAGLAGCRRPVEHIVPYVDAPETVIPGVPRHFATTVPFGTNAYGVVVESHENRPTKLEGNALHPSSLGAANAWMQASLLNLYDPERSHTVLQREVGEAVANVEGEGEVAETTALPDAVAGTWEEFEAFWKGRSAELAATGGEGLAVLSESYTSPSFERIRGEFLARFPNARFVVWEAVGNENIFAGCEQATGLRCRPVYNLEKAKVIVSLDADFLGVESESLSQSRGFSRGRKMETHRDEMNRLYAVESALSITGSMADHRVRLKSRLIGAFAAALGAELGVGAAVGDLPTDVQHNLALIAADLRGAGAGLW